MTHSGPFQPLLFCVILCDSVRKQQKKEGNRTGGPEEEGFSAAEAMLVGLSQGQASSSTAVSDHKPRSFSR